MIVYDLNELGALVIGRLTTDAQGADVRAALPDPAAASIIHGRDIEEQSFGSGTRVVLPPRPLIAWREGPIALTARVVSWPIYRIFIYDDSEQGYARINNLVTLLARAYAAEPVIQFAQGGVIGSVGVVDASSSTSDPSLNLLLRFVTVQVMASG